MKQRTPRVDFCEAAPRVKHLRSFVLVLLREVERRAFAHALRNCAGNVAKAAKALGVAKGTFYSKIRRYGLLLQKEEHPTSAPIESQSPFRKLLS